MNTAIVYVDTHGHPQYYIKPTDQLTQEDKRIIQLVTTNEKHADLFYNNPHQGWQWTKTVDKSTIDCAHIAVSSDP